MKYSIVKKSQVCEVSTLRFDAEYYEPKYLDILKCIEKKAKDFTKLSHLGLQIDASAFYPALEPYYNKGNLPFLRVQDINNKINYEDCLGIPETIEKDKTFETLKFVQTGDIVITKGGSIARVGLVERKSAACRDLIFINSSKLSNIEYKFLYVYCLSYIYKNLLIRSSSMTAQPHLTITLVREVPIYGPNLAFKTFIAKLVDKLSNLDKLCHCSYIKAENILLDELNIENWSPKHKLWSVKNYSDVKDANRLDAEYFQSKYDEIMNILNKNGYTRLIDNFNIVRNSGLEYHEDGKIGVIKTKQIKDKFIDFNVESKTNLYEDNVIVKNKDVLFASMGVGSLGKTNIYYNFENNNEFIIDSTLKIFRKKINGSISPELLEAYLHTQIAQELIYQNVVGSSGIISVYESYLQELPIPIINNSVEQKIVENIKTAHLLYYQSKQLLEIAKRGVEIAIEQDENIATNWINQELQKIGVEL
ncbi:TPA: restriction endonuclease subunit S [Candidatus Gastranaerophilales bacterium HUM_6]|nr:restriction modification system DNA specificity domain-containing protein [Fusobacterium sp. CAG:815]DAA91303.1 MAG TPA: restriction endonuclease subunit S [Candidatus Gastranaerophilales bacterium HUM_7]DAA91627.1 MAG TPA: restriction endonuclease subunit S [Candidatus Gastranaerophilales bacterium HUM_6]DAB02980.1 MAG TPA: restriction endonuclease subunit S [Candidatus Gastranaerophilales bacterium HUM_12]DAB06888.1 MAG TPA: restriction endonuclease subunit S [Candidatus Gastranaerophilale